MSENSIFSEIKNDEFKIVYDNISNHTLNGLNGKYGSQIVILTFLDRKGNIQTDEIKKRTFSLLLREPFKVSLSTKAPSESPYISLKNKILENIKEASAFSLLNGDVNKLNVNENSTEAYNKILKITQSPYDPINITDDYSFKMYSGLNNHPTFNLNCRLYMDKMIFNTFTEGYENNKTNYKYITDCLLKLLECILPTSILDAENGKFEDTIKDKIQNVIVGTAIKKYKWVQGYVALDKLIDNKFNPNEIAKKIDSVNEGSYGNNIVAFSIPYIFGNVSSLGSVNRPSYEEENKFNVGEMLNMKCFVKHVDFSLSKENFVYKELDGRPTMYPSYIDINIVLESVTIPSVKNWITNWVSLR